MPETETIDQCNMRLMVVDDEPHIRNSIVQLLEKYGFCCVESFENGGDALEALGQRGSDLVLSDVKMPGIDGVDLLEQARALCPLTPVILMSGNADLEMAIAAVKKGAFDFIVKPIDVDYLMASVNKALTFRRLKLLELNYRTELEHTIEEKVRELQFAHEKLIMNEKMAMLGQIAAGVAHEINNPVGFVSSNLVTLAKYLARFSTMIDIQKETITRHCSPEVCAELTSARAQIKLDAILDDAPALIGECHDGVERIKTIAKGLKSFSRNDGEFSEPVNVNDVLENSLTIIKNEIKYVATVTTEYGEIPSVIGFRNQLGQVFMNIIINAAHAIVGQGEICIRTWATESNVFVTITDNGTGIPEGVMKRIFEPFFTTKEVGKGTGLGLSISYDIVRKHGGEISVESEVGRGTTFAVKLPLGRPLQQ